MSSARALILQWIEQGTISAENADLAVSASGIKPSTQDWRHFLDQLLLWSGALALSTAVIFFFAFNWETMGRLSRFALVEGLIVCSLAAYWKLGADTTPGKAALMTAALLLGALMALFGQTYQTGADPWQLFAGWAVLISPWVLVGRLAALWLFWIGLLNLACYLYFSIRLDFWGLFRDWQQQLLLAALFNSLALAAWELGALRFNWLNARWAVRLLAVAGGAAITSLVMFNIFDWSDSAGWGAWFYPLWIAGFYWAYRYRIPDLFMLAGMAFSLIVIITSLLARAMLDEFEAGGFLVIAAVIIGMSGGAALWLKNLHQEFES